MWQWLKSEYVNFPVRVYQSESRQGDNRTGIVRDVVPDHYGSGLSFRVEFEDGESECVKVERCARLRRPGRKE